MGQDPSNQHSDKWHVHNWSFKPDPSRLATPDRFGEIKRVQEYDMSEQKVGLTLIKRRDVVRTSVTKMEEQINVLEIKEELTHSSPNGPAIIKKD